MNRILLFIISISLTCSSRITIIAESFDFKTLIENDISNLTRLIADLDTIKKESHWLEFYRNFYGLWLEGAKHELNGDSKTAIEHYKKALKHTRYRKLTYNIELPLGRALIQKGNRAKARIMLNRFKKEAEIDLNSNDLEWQLSEKGVVKLKKGVELCDNLLTLINNKN